MNYLIASDLSYEVRQLRRLQGKDATGRLHALHLTGYRAVHVRRFLRSDDAGDAAQPTPQTVAVGEVSDEGESDLGGHVSHGGRGDLASHRVSSRQVRG